MSAGPRQGVIIGGRNDWARDGVFDARPHWGAEALGRRLAGRRLTLAAPGLWAIAFVVLGAVTIGIGLLLTNVLLHGGVGRLDASIISWFVVHRTKALDTATWVGSETGSTGVIIGVTAIALIALAVRRHWRQAGFLVCAMTLEFFIFMIATVVVARSRPTVLQLDVAPPTSSYPSGHTSSALTLYVGLAIVAWSLVRNSLVRALVWSIAIALPIFVGISRLYRGMHFPTDVIGAIVLGCLALVFALFITRTLTTAAAARQWQPTDTHTS